MKISPFEMERWQSIWEHRVAVNLSESGVEPVALAEFMGEGDLSEVLHTPLGYTETRGSEALREAVAGLYPDCGPENVLLTAGSAEANFLSVLATAEKATPFVAVLPNYMQVWGLARSWAKGVPLPLREDRGWQPDPEEVKVVVGPGTTAISLSHPNNPTGVPLSGQSRGILLDAAEDAGAWVLSDEVYRGVEREGGETPTFWGEAERVVVTSGLSKAYGLPGLRLGWACGPPEFIDRLWALHDYTTIAINKLADLLARRALGPWRERLLDRARSLLRQNFPLLQSFVEENALSWVPPHAGAIAFFRYPGTTPSLALAERAREAGVLVVPGAHFRQEGYLRLGYGMEAEVLKEGLGLLQTVLDQVAKA
ncbi:MAG: aminotransferase class I/II-fold pyridoxal phosphate-dependent enzyme [Thermoplasmata archaeon]